MSHVGARIVRTVGGELEPALIAQLDAIFFEASGRTFEPGPEREAFRERWLGRYLRGGTDVALLALSGESTLAGYLVGALENPSNQARFADIDYFHTDFAALCCRFPAHLHVNLAPAFRGVGLGARLIEAFAMHAAEAGARGMHAVTGKAARNVRFYLRCGFAEHGTAWWRGRELVFLGRALTGPA